jgi:hypothetical protein
MRGISVGRLVIGAAGIVVMVIGGTGMLFGGVATSWPVSAGWAVGGIAAHDALIGPLACCIGWLIVRFLPPVMRAPLQGGLIVAGAVMVVSVPVVVGRGRDAGNPSALPGDYPLALMEVLGVVAISVIALMLTGAFRRRKARNARLSTDQVST